MNSKVLLNGKWKYITDKNNNLNIESVLTKLKKSILSDISIPNNWQLAGLNNFNGTVWFIKSFKFNYNENIYHQSILKFYGIDYFTDVWLNNYYLGSHEGYFQSFIFDVTHKIQKNNILVVKVNSPKELPGTVWPHNKKLIKGIFNHHDCRPGGWSYDYGQDQNTGGIWNDVVLFTQSKVFFENVKITPTLQKNFSKSKVKLEIKYQSNFNFNDLVKIKLISPDGSIINYQFEIKYRKGRHKTAFTFIIDKPDLWWSWDLGKPNLYSIVIKSDYHNEINETFGIREVKIDKQSNFYLNGKKLFLRGTNIIPTQFLSELNRIRIRKIVNLIKNSNVNIVRVHAHVNRKELYRELDKKGILVWQDFSLQWTYEISNKFTANAVKQIKEMVNQLYNHSSIAFWCCHNEPGEQIKTLDKKLYTAVTEEDTSRIVRLASNYEEHPYDGWYWGMKEHFVAAPMGPLVTEFGAQAIPEINSMKKMFNQNELYPPNYKKWQYHNFQTDQTFNIAKISCENGLEKFIDNSQNYQANLIHDAIHYYRRQKNQSITGIFQFMFIDCWPSITWSVVDYYLNKKNGYYSLMSAFKPVLLSINLRQDQYFLGSKLNLDLYVINDTYKKYENLIVKFYLNKKSIGEIKALQITENSIIFKNFEDINILLPKKGKVGKYKLDCILYLKGKKIAEENYEVTLVKNIPKI